MYIRKALCVTVVWYTVLQSVNGADPHTVLRVLWSREKREISDGIEARLQLATNHIASERTSRCGPQCCLDQTGGEDLSQGARL